MSAEPSGPRADFGVRVVALLIDMLVFAVAAALLWGAFGWFGWFLTQAVGVAYWTYFEGSPSGQSPGKRVMNIRVVDVQSGVQVGYARAAVRGLMKGVSLGVCFLGCLWTLWDPERQSWHDKVANTLVVPTSTHPVTRWPA